MQPSIDRNAYTLSATRKEKDDRMNLIAPRAAGLALAGLLLAVVCHAYSGSTGPSPDLSYADAAAALLGLVLMPLELWVVCRLLIRQVKVQMMTASTEQEAVAIEELQAPKEDAAVVPRMSIDEADLTTEEMSEPRRRREQVEQRLFRRTALMDLSIALMYALPAALVTGGITFVFAFFVFTVMRYLLHRRRFRAFNLSRSRKSQRMRQRLARVGRFVLIVVSVGTRTTVSSLEYVPEVTRAIFGLRMRAVLSVAMMIYMAMQGLVILAEKNVAGVLLLAIAGLHAGIFAAQSRKMRRIPGIRLLILRVFDVDTSSAFTFNGLTGYWRHFGNHFTVVDPSLVRQEYASRTWSGAFLILLSYVLLGAVSASIIGPFHLDHLSLAWVWCCLLVALIALLLGWAFLAIEKHRLAGRFVRSRGQLLSQLQQVCRYPRNMDQTFRHIEAPCYDNTWFIAVVEFARRADVVLMDLRGYSEQRKGCQKEVDFLFDVVPVERLLFLVDIATDLVLVQDMLAERWRHLRHTSPNLPLTHPVIHMYLSRDNDERDMQALLDRLIAAADAPTASAVPSFSTAEAC